MEDPQRSDRAQQPEVRRAVRVRGRGVRGHDREEALDRRGADELRATLIDHAVNHGLTMPEAGRTGLQGFLTGVAEVPFYTPAGGCHL
ncbi:hypothetical protein SRHO_G00076570 [Serrasalmus rhombeus]